MEKRASKRASKAEEQLTPHLDVSEPASELDEAKKIAQDIENYDYQVRLMYSHTHHENLVSKEERKEIVTKLEKALELAKRIRSEDESLAEELSNSAERLLAIVAANDYLASGKKKLLDECLERCARCGWEAFGDEPWRAQLVAKAAKVSYQAALATVNDQPDLVRAIDEAPAKNNRLSVVPEGFGTPPKKK